MHRYVFPEMPIPLVQTATDRRARIVGVKREQHDLVTTRSLQSFHRFGSKGMPVAHRDKTTGADAITVERGFQSPRLTFRETPDRGTAADHRIVMFDFFGAGGRDQLRKRTPPDAGEREVDDVGIAKQVIKKRLD